MLRAEPDWSSLPAATPMTIRRLLRRCLTKDPRERLHDIADARLDIRDAPAEHGNAIAPSPVRRRVLAWSVLGALSVLSVSLVIILWYVRPDVGGRPRLPKRHRAAPDRWGSRQRGAHREHQTRARALSGWPATCVFVSVGSDGRPLPLGSVARLFNGAAAAGDRRHRDRHKPYVVARRPAPGVLC